MKGSPTPDTPPASAPSHTSVLVLSLAVAVALLGVKFWAYAATGSQAVFGDALESCVNVLAAAFALRVIVYAGQPPDRDHPWGHGKVEFFSAVFEGGLIAVAAVLVIWQAVPALLRGAEVGALDLGLALTIAAGLGNGALGLFLVRYGRTHGSIAIEADGHHLLSDFWTSVGVVVGLVGVRSTGLVWIDPTVAIVMAVWLFVTGWRLIRRAAGGLLDEEDPELLRTIVERIAPRLRDGLIRVHRLRAIRAGRFRHISAHLVVPEFWAVEQAHDTAEALAATLQRELPGDADVTFHTDPCERAYCSRCDLEACSVRRQPFVRFEPLSVDEAVDPEPPLHHAPVTPGR